MPVPLILLSTLARFTVWLRKRTKSCCSLGTAYRASLVGLLLVSVE